jgi:hypothetical protein
VKQGGGTRHPAIQQPAGEQDANGKRGAQGQEATEPHWALRSGGRVERTRGRGIDATTTRQTRDFCGGGKSVGGGDGDGNGDGKCRAPLSRNLAATALVLTAEDAAALIADDADGGNSGVTIVGRASLTAGGGLIINSIINVLSTLYFLPLLGTNIVTHHGVS